MTADSLRILTEATALPPEERAQLVDEILASFDSPEQRAINTAWATESEGRIDAYELGELQAKPITEVLARLDRKYPA